MKKIILISIICMTTSGLLFAQKVKLVKGNFSSLKGQPNVNLKYDYNELMVGKLTESEYVQKKYAEYEKKEPGRGDKFKTSWESDRKKRYEPKFEELINKGVEDISFGNFPDAEYTIVINTTFIDPGYNVGVSKKPAFLNTEIKLVDKAGNEKAEVTVFRAPGNQFGGMDYDAGVRISECYAITAKRLGALINKEMK